MGREARVEIPGYYYHIIVRGQRKNPIFFSDDDFMMFLKLLSIYSKRLQTNIGAFCLMRNHVHLLIKRKNIPFERIMRPLLTAYATYFNEKYELSGHVFQGRYKSFIILNVHYLFAIVPYIHNNPEKAGIVENAESYKYSSIHNYRKTKYKPVFRNLKLDELRETNIDIEDFICQKNQYIGSLDEYTKIEKRKPGRESGNYKERRLDINSDANVICVCNDISLDNLLNKKWRKGNKLAKTLILKKLVLLGYSQSDIARFFNCSRGYVSRCLSEE